MDNYLENIVIGNIIGIALFLIIVMISLKKYIDKLQEKNNSILEKVDENLNVINALIDRVSDCIILVDSSGTILSANLRFIEYYGKPLEKLVGKNVQRISSDYVHSEHFDAITKSLKEKNHYEMDIRFFKENGEIIPFHINISCFEMENRKIFGIIGTDKKSSNEKDKFIQQQETELLEIQHLAHIGYWVIDNPYKKVFWSKELYSILGYEEEEVQPNLNIIYSMVHMDDRERVNKAFRISFQTQEKFDIQYRLINKSKELIDVYLRIRHMFSEKNEHLGTIGILQDISQQVNFQEELKEQLLYSDTVLDYFSSYYIAVDNNLQVVNINRHFARLVGTTKEGSLGKKMVEFFGKISEEQRCFLKENTEFEKPMPLVDVEGELHYIQWDFSLFFKRNGEIINTFFGVDVTETVKEKEEIKNLFLNFGDKI